MTFSAPVGNFLQVCGFKNFLPPPRYDREYLMNNGFSKQHKLFSDIELPESRKLKIVDRIPQFPPGVRPPKMQKKLRFMRGEEDVHNFLIHKQYGIMV